MVVIAICSLKGFGQIVKMGNSIDQPLSITMSGGGFNPVYRHLPVTTSVYYAADNVSLLSFTNYKNNTITIYNLDGTLYRQLAYPKCPTGTTMTKLYLTTNLFNDNDSVEFFYKYNRGYQSIDTTIVSNENGNVLMSLPGEGLEFFFSNSIGEHFMLMEGVYGHSIYKINPIKTSISQTKIQLQKMPFPNPSKTTVNLPYQLSLGQQATMKIFDVNGKSIVTKQIDATSDRLQLDVSNYTKGMYLYEYNGKSGKFVVE